MLSVLQWIPVAVAEQLVCEEVAVLLIGLAEGEAQLATAGDSDALDQ